MRHLLLLFLIACNVPGTAHSRPPAEATSATAPSEMGVHAFHEVWRAGEGVFLDVRSPQEFAAGHVPGAVLLPVQDLSADATQAEAWRDETVYVYCRTSNRSGVASRILRDAGFASVVQVRGGFTDWAAEGFPSE